MSLYIKEGDYGRWAGCYVQVPGFPGRLFSWSTHGRREARRQAIAYRDGLLPSSLWAGHLGHWVKRNAQRNSRTGILGVHLQRKGRRQVVVAECVGQGRRQFSVERYGLQRALRLAARARQQMVKAKLTK